MNSEYVIEPIHNLPYPGGFLMRKFLYLRKKFKNTSLYQSKKNTDFGGNCDDQISAIRTVRVSGPSQSIFDNLFSDLFPFEGVEIYLHGSRADNTYNDFSDFDDLIVIDSKIITDPEYPLAKLVQVLNRVDMRFCRHDPLQHHGHWIIDKNSLCAFNESYMPLIVLKDAVPIKGSREISYRIDIQNTKKGLQKNIVNTANNISKMYKQFSEGRLNCYGLKCLVGSFALMPAFLFQLQGININKPTAINRANGLFPADAIRCIEWASSLRNSWYIITTHSKYKYFKQYCRFFINPFLYRSFAAKFAPRISVHKVNDLPSINNKMVESFLTRAINLAGNEA